MGKRTNLMDKQTRTFSGKAPRRVPMTADECRNLCVGVNLEYLEGYEGRVVEHVITDETVDRYGDRIIAKGGDFGNFHKNPVIPFAHDYHDLPVGKALKVWYDKGDNNVKAWGLFFDNRVDSTGRADVVFKFIAAGGLPACSVGFVPLSEPYRPKSTEERESMGLGQMGVEYREWDLLEYSPCPVPANPNALQNALKAEGWGRRDFEVVKANAEQFKGLLPEDFVQQIIKLAESTEPPKAVEPEPVVIVNNTAPTLVITDNLPPPPVDNGKNESSLTDNIPEDILQAQIDATKQLTETMKTLGATVKELTLALERTVQPKANQAEPKAPEPASAEDL